jgi:D-alanyl-D-alanine carboxypeptidase
MGMQKFVLFWLFLAIMGAVDVVAQSEGNARSGPYAEEYFNRLNQLQESFKWVFEKPLAPPIDTADAWQKWKTVENFSFGKDRGSLPMIADLQSLHPFFRDKIIELVAQCKKKGIELAVVETYRTHAKQNEYKAMGKKYTRSGGGSSKHQYGLAVDLVPVVDSVAQWNNAALWRKVGLTGERLGLRWGGRWRHPYDPGHFEWTGGLSSYHFAKGTFPAIPKPQLYPCVAEDLKHLKRYWNEWETEQASLARKNKAATKTAMK